MLLGYRDPRELSGDYELEGLAENLQQLAGLLEALTSAAASAS